MARQPESLAGPGPIDDSGPARERLVDRPVPMAGKEAASRRHEPRRSGRRPCASRRPPRDLTWVKSRNSCSAPAQARSDVQSWKTSGAASNSCGAATGAMISGSRIAGRTESRAR